MVMLFILLNVSHSNLLNKRELVLRKAELQEGVTTFLFVFYETLTVFFYIKSNKAFLTVLGIVCRCQFDRVSMNCF